jgi:hypothetical protein
LSVSASNAWSAAREALRARRTSAIATSPAPRSSGCAYSTATPLTHEGLRSTTAELLRRRSAVNTADSRPPLRSCRATPTFRP